MKNRGQTLVELLITMGLAALLFPALLTGFVASREGKAQEGQRAQAVALLKETETAVKSIKNSNWTTFANLSGQGVLHPLISGNAWTSTTGSETIGAITRQFVVSDVNRDTNDAIVLSGGTLDPSTKKVLITITWNQPYTTSITSTLYLSRTNNTTYIETTQAQFDTGIKTSVITTNISGGEVALAAGGGGGDWCNPSKSITAVDLPKSGVANAITAIAGPASAESTVFAGTGENAAGVSFAKVDIPGNPPTPSTVATFDGYKTNAVFGENNYAYFATDNNAKEIVIIDLNQYSDPPTNSKYKEVGSINLSGNVNGDSVYVVNNKAYITSSDKKFYIYDVTSHSSPSLLNSGGLTLDGEGERVLVAGNYAYVATNSTTYQLEIVDISNTSNPTIVGKLNLGTSQSGVDVYVNTANANPTRAYLVTSPTSGQKDFYIVNVSTKNAPTIAGLSGYDTNGMTPTGLTVVTGNRAIIVGSGGASQYQVLDISNESGTLTTCATLSYATGIRGVASVLQDNGYAYSYIVTGDASAELKIILGGAGGQFNTSGTFESQVFDATSSAAFNRFIATITQPSQTTIKMQVAIRPPVSGSCPSASSQYTYVGPNGDSSAYFTPTGSSISGVIPFGNYQSNAYQNPERCFRYKTWFNTTDYTQSPVLYDMTVNYSQ